MIDTKILKFFYKVYLNIKAHRYVTVIAFQHYILLFGLYNKIKTNLQMTMG